MDGLRDRKSVWECKYRGFWIKQFKNGGCYLPLRFNSLFMGVWRQIAEYFYIKKRDPNAPHTQWMKYMHGINRISIFMFLAAIIILIIKLILKKH